MELVAPFKIVIDQRERDGPPYAFATIRSDAAQGRRHVTVPTEMVHLVTGDYTLAGLEDRFTVERKGGVDGVADLYRTLGQDRKRFVRQLERMALMEWSAVVVEAGWDVVMRGSPWSRLLPKNVFRTVLTWSQRYPKTHWFMCPGRPFAEVMCYRLIERFWNDTQAKLSPPRGRPVAAVAAAEVAQT